MKERSVLKKMVSIMLAFVMIISMLPVSAAENNDDDKDFPTFTSPTAVTNFTESETPQPLVTIGRIEGGEFLFRLGLDGEWSEEIPTATTAASYTVYWYVRGDANHKDYGSPSSPGGKVTIQSGNNGKVQFLKGSNGFNIKLFYNGNWIKTTYGDYCYKVVVQVGDNSAVTLNSSFEFGKTFTVNGVEVTVYAEIPPGSDAVSINYELKNTTDEDLSVKIGSWSDTQVGNNDRANIYIENGDTLVLEDNSSGTTGGARYKITSGLGPFTTMWYGHYSSASSNVFNSQSEDYVMNGDSGVAWSWTVGLPAGEDYTMVCGGDVGSVNSQSIKATGINAVYGDTDLAVNAELTKGDGELSYAVTSGTDVIDIDPVTGEIAIKNAGLATVAITASETENFERTTKTVPIRISKKEVALHWTETEFVYDGEAHSPIAEPVGLVGEDECTVIVEDSHTDVGEYTSLLKQWSLSNNNYKIVSEDGQIAYSIVKRVLSLDWNNQQVVYDGKSHLPGLTVTNFVGDDTCTSSVVGEKVNSGEYTATADVADFDESKYALPEKMFTPFNILPANPGLSIETVPGKTYGDESFALNVNKVTTADKITFASSDENIFKVNENGIVTIVGAGTAEITASVEAVKNYAAGSASINITAAKKGASFALTELVYNKTYGDEPFLIEANVIDGESKAEFIPLDTSVAVSENGKIKIVGAGKTDIKIVLPESENYKAFSDKVVLNVAPKKVTVKVNDEVKTFGKPDPDMTSVITGLVEGDELEIEYERQDERDYAGVYEVFPVVKPDPRYEIETQSGTLTIVQAQSVITVLRTKFTYGDTTPVHFVKTNNSAKIRYSVKEGYPDNIAVIDSNGLISPVNAGTTVYIVSTAFTSSHFAAEKEVEVVVSPREASVEWGNDLFTYDGQPHVAEAFARGLLGDDESDVIVSGEQTNAGEYTATASGFTNSNYTLTKEYESSFTIEKADPGLVFGSITKTYGDGTFRPEFSKKTDADIIFTSSDESIVKPIDNGLLSVVGAGTVTITAEAPETLNFYGKTEKINITVDKKDGSLDIVGVDYTKTYGDEDFSIGDITTENGAVLSYTSDNEDVVSVDNNGIVKINGVGQANIIVKLNETEDYSSSVSTITVSVSPKPLTLNWSDLQFVYDGKTHIPTVKVSGTVGSDKPAINIIGEAVDAGTYTAYAATDDSRYTIPDNSSAEYVINKAEREIILDDCQATYGDEAFSIPLDTSDVATSFASSNEKTARVDSDGVVSIIGAGEAEITVTIPEDKNHLVFNGSFKVNIAPKKLIVKVEPAQKVYGSEDPEFTFTADGILESDTPDIAVSRESGENAGEYKLTPVVSDNANYVVEAVTSVLTILKAEQTISTENITAKLSSEDLNVNASTNGDGVLSYEIVSGKSVSVDNAGNITPLSAGDSVIRITASETENYKAASRDITVSIETAAAVHTVTFSDNVVPEVVAEGEKLVKPNDPEKEGFKFEGWYKDEACTEVFDFNESITSDIALYAKWTKLVMSGDINEDDDITSEDALAILRFSIGLNEADEQMFLIADVDKDEEITASDALAVLRYSVGYKENDNIGQYI